MVKRERTVAPGILGGARDAIEQYGWSAATLERIAQAAGTSRMTLHRAGVTKQAILEELAHELEEEHRATLWPALTALGTGRERLEQALTLECQLAERSLALLAALDNHSHGFVFHEDGDSGFSREVFTEPLQRLLRDGIADGTLVGTDVAETATILFNMVGLTYRHLRLAHGWTPERALQGVVATSMSGVVSAGAQAEGSPGCNGR